MPSGGPGRRKLSKEDKIIRILTNLPHISNKQTNPGFNKNDIGKSISDRTTNWAATVKLIDDLDASGCIIKRSAEKHERGDYYYYKSDKGNLLINNISKTRGLLQPLN